MDKQQAITEESQEIKARSIGAAHSPPSDTYMRIYSIYEIVNFTVPSR